MEVVGSLVAESIRNRHVAPAANISRDKMAQRTNAVAPVRPTDWRTWDALGTNLPGTPANDDLGLVTGTFGSDPGPYLGTGDVKAASGSRRAAAFVPVPHDYEAGETLTFRVHAGMITSVADGSCTVDLEAYRIDRDGTLTAGDLIATAAQSINDLSAGEYDFEVTVTDLTPGDVIILRLTVAYVDAATATAVIGAVYQVDLLADLR